MVLLNSCCKGIRGSGVRSELDKALEHVIGWKSSRWVQAWLVADLSENSRCENIWSELPRVPRMDKDWLNATWLVEHDNLATPLPRISLVFTIYIPLISIDHVSTISNIILANAPESLSKKGLKSSQWWGPIKTDDVFSLCTPIINVKKHGALLLKMQNNDRQNWVYIQRSAMIDND